MALQEGTMIRTCLAAAAFLTASVLFAQTGGAKGGTTPTTGTGGKTSVPSNPANTAGGNSKPVDSPRPIYISGKVVMQDGTPVPMDVTIQRLCRGVSHTVAYTDSHGRFSFQWDDRNTVVADASDAGSNRNSSAQSWTGSSFNSDPFGSRMMNCELRASLGGYSSDVVNLFSRRITDSPDIGLIVLHRIQGVEGTSISATALAAPKDARKAYEHGLQALTKNQPGEAVKGFEKATALYPKYADAWVNLGKIRLQQKFVESARDAFVRAIECDSRLVTPYVELGILSAVESKWQESGKYLDQALKLDPVDFPQAWYTDAVAHYNLKDYDAAEKGAREAVRLDPRHANPRADYLLGMILVEKKDYAGAAQELENYVKFAPNAPDIADARNKLGQLERLNAGQAAVQTAAQQR